MLLLPKCPFVVQESTTGSLGLFLKNEAVTTKHGCLLMPEWLWGMLFWVDDDNFGKLQSRDYPLLYRDACCSYIMCRPLSLANHQCR